MCIFELVEVILCAGTPVGGLDWCVCEREVNFVLLDS